MKAKIKIEVPDSEIYQMLLKRLREKSEWYEKQRERSTVAVFHEEADALLLVIKILEDERDE